MPREAPAILHGLADLYRKSAAGSRGGARDFIVDYEQLLRHANCHDGDARENAEADLKRAELESEGLLALDRAPRSNLFLRVRVSKEGGEAWLFARLGETSPGERREDLAEFFQSMGEQTVPEGWKTGWQAWCELLVRAALSHSTVQPFKRGDPEGNRAFLKALLGVIHWEGESLIRFASSVICADSKKLESLENRLVSALQAIRGDTSVSLENLGILRKPRTLTFHGPLVLKFGSGTVDFKQLPGPSRISEVNLIKATEISTDAELCLTIENEEVFLEIAKRNRNWLLVHTSFPGSAVRRLFKRLPADLDCYHFGDSDPAGFDILRDLREKTSRRFLPVCMEFRPERSAPPLTADDRATLGRLLAAPSLSDVEPALKSMLESGSKGNFEQETVPLPQVFGALDSAEPPRCGQ